MTSTFTVEDHIIAAVRRIIRAVDLHSRRLVETYGLTGPQLATLQEAGRLGGVSASDLARAVHISHSTLTGILDRLERRGLVTRTRKGEDRRSVTVTVTHEGAAILEAAPSLLQDRFREELAKLQEWEQTMMLGTLQRIAAMMDAEGIDASPVLVTGSVGAASQDVADQRVGPTVAAAPRGGRWAPAALRRPQEGDAAPLKGQAEKPVPHTLACTTRSQQAAVPSATFKQREVE